MLKGIETQTMVTRTTDIMREADIHQRRNELARDFHAVQTQALIEHEQKYVTQTLKSQQVVIHKDKQERERRQHEEEERSRAEAEAAPIQETDTAELARATLGNYIIDIKI